MPQRIIQVDPVGLGADAFGVCKCDNGAQYIMKGAKDAPTLPHDEWFCTQLAEEVGIACPHCDILEDPKGETFFGSRCEGGVISQVPWPELVVRRELEFDQVAPILSRVLAFDLFVYNEDRHVENFLVRDSRLGSVLLTIDFSRAWSVHGMPPPKLPMPAETNTISYHREWKRIIGEFVKVDVVNSFLDKLAAIRVPTIEGIIDRHPDEWITPKMRKDVITWWGSPARIERIDGIRKGIEDGSYL